MISLVVPTIVSSESVAVQESTSTLDNLQTAFNGESNANARYLAFARKADEEGFGEVASLFRAAAKAEEVHARNHGDVIRKMGATPALNLEPIEVKTTHENLKAAIAGEKYERDIMYPKFVEVAQAAESDCCSSDVHLRVEGRGGSCRPLSGRSRQPAEANRQEPGLLCLSRLRQYT
jgi:rubrerythrin